MNVNVKVKTRDSFIFSVYTGFCKFFSGSFLKTYFTIKSGRLGETANQNTNEETTQGFHRILTKETKIISLFFFMCLIFGCFILYIIIKN